MANVAAIYPPSTLETVTTELFYRVFDVNVLGVINIMAAAPHMPEGSAIVNFASVDGFTVSPGQLVYGASKAAVIMITKATALELAPRRIRVNAIAPGWVDTPGNAATGRMQAAAASIPLGRVARPSEIAELGLAAHRRRCGDVHDGRDRHLVRWRRHPLKPIPPTPAGKEERPWPATASSGPVRPASPPWSSSARPATTSTATRRPTGSAATGTPTMTRCTSSPRGT